MATDAEKHGLQRRGEHHPKLSSRKITKKVIECLNGGVLNDKELEVPQQRVINNAFWFAEKAYTDSKAPDFKEAYRKAFVTKYSESNGLPDVLRAVQGDDFWKGVFEKEKVSTVKSDEGIPESQKPDLATKIRALEELVEKLEGRLGRIHGAADRLESLGGDNGIKKSDAQGTAAKIDLERIMQRIAVLEKAIRALAGTESGQHKEQTSKRRTFVAKAPQQEAVLVPNVDHNQSDGVTVTAATAAAAAIATTLAATTIGNNGGAKEEAPKEEAPKEEAPKEHGPVRRALEEWRVSRREASQKRKAFFNALKGSITDKANTIDDFFGTLTDIYMYPGYYYVLARNKASGKMELIANKIADQLDGGTERGQGSTEETTDTSFLTMLAAAALAQGLPDQVETPGTTTPLPIPKSDEEKGSTNIQHPPKERTSAVIGESEMPIAEDLWSRVELTFDQEENRDAQVLVAVREIIGTNSDITASTSLKDLKQLYHEDVSENAPGFDINFAFRIGEYERIAKEEFGEQYDMDYYESVVGYNENSDDLMTLGDYVRLIEHMRTQKNAFAQTQRNINDMQNSDGIPNMQRWIEENSESMCAKLFFTAKNPEQYNEMLVENAVRFMRAEERQRWNAYREEAMALGVSPEMFSNRSIGDIIRTVEIARLTKDIDLNDAKDFEFMNAEHDAMRALLREKEQSDNVVDRLTAQVLRYFHHPELIDLPEADQCLELFQNVQEILFLTAIGEIWKNLSDKEKALFKNEVPEDQVQQNVNSLVQILSEEIKRDGAIVTKIKEKTIERLNAVAATNPEKQIEAESTE